MANKPVSERRAKILKIVRECMSNYEISSIYSYSDKRVKSGIDGRDMKFFGIKDKNSGYFDRVNPRFVEELKLRLPKGIGAEVKIGNHMESLRIFQF
jgi:hypothetical protein